MSNLLIGFAVGIVVVMWLSAHDCEVLRRGYNFTFATDAVVHEVPEFYYCNE